MNLKELTIAKAAAGLRDKTFSAVELTKATLEHINKRNSAINAYISITDESALEEAKYADSLLASDNAHALTGIPFGVKDAICTKDIRSTGAGKILDNYVPPFNATVIESIRNQGAVLVGKQNCDTFGHGASNENSMYGPVKNPHDETKVAGGSSGGSAAALVDGQCIFSIAEDTGGSIRYPAALCGVSGLRPSYGRHSRYGIMPMASSFDTVGAMAHTVEDLALLEEIIAGHDPKDATSVKADVPAYTKEIQKDLKGLTIGIPKEYFEVDGLDPEVAACIEAQREVFTALGCTFKEVSLPHTKYAVPTYYILVPSEDSSNMGRLDGIRYGMPQAGDSLYDVYANSRANGFPEEVKRRIMMGTYALSAGYYDAYYKKAQKVRTKIIQDFDEAFQTVDVLMTPTSPFPAFGIGEKNNDILAMYLADILVSPGAVAGIPGLSLNAGFTKAGLPIGMQIMGPRLQEEVILRVGHQYQIATA